MSDMKERAERLYPDSVSMQEKWLAAVEFLGEKWVCNRARFCARKEGV